MAGMENQAWKDDARRKLSELTHDIRNPIATFQSFLHILEMENYQFQPTELKELSESVQNALQQALDKIDERVKHIKTDWKL